MRPPCLPFHQPGAGSDNRSRYGVADDPRALERAQRLGLIRPLGDGWYEEVSPALARAGSELQELGISTKAALDVVERLRKQTAGAARAFVNARGRVFRPTPLPAHHPGRTCTGQTLRRPVPAR